MKKQDWRKQLSTLQNEMKASMTEREKREYEAERQSQRNRIVEIERRKRVLYEFLAGYKHNSGIFINNFFRNRDYQTYCEDKFEMFDFEVCGMQPNLFDNPLLSMAMVEYLGKLENAKIAYYPISVEYVRRLIAFAEVLELTENLDATIPLYRGCSILERNGISGIVSTTTDIEIAKQFNRGTLLKIHVQNGAKGLDVNRIRPKKDRKKFLEKEVLLPPCTYQILKEKEENFGGPNNHTGKTKVIELAVEELDVLKEFLKAMKNPPIEYEIFRQQQGNDYEEAILYLEDYLEKRSAKEKVKRRGN